MNRSVVGNPGLIRALQRVELRWRTYEGDLVSVPGQIQDFDDSAIDLWYDRAAPGYQPLESRQKLDILVPVDSALLVVPVVVSRRVPVDRVVVEINGEPVRAQRRQYVRERVGLEVQASLRRDSAEGVPPSEIRLVDISAGGVCFRSSQPIEPGERVQIAMSLRPDLAFEAVAQIVACDQAPAGATGSDQHPPYTVRACFPDLPERERQRITRYVFQRQALARQRTR